MAVTLSHQSALDVIRTLRANMHTIRELDTTTLRCPTPWVGKRWSKRVFESPKWRWSLPQKDSPLHVLVPLHERRIHVTNVRMHATSINQPAGSIVWLDEVSSVVCPELLFVQMAEVFALPQLVMLGYELCGHFSRNPQEPLCGDIVQNVPTATSVERIKDFLPFMQGARNVLRAKEALNYVHDHAMSAPEAVLATIYSLPCSESGYGLGPITLNERVTVDDQGSWSRAKARYPDLLFSFAPIGINYDGQKDHLDLLGLVEAAQRALNATEDNKEDSQKALAEKIRSVRAKVIDDNLRNRQLMAQGKIVFSVTKEDLGTGGQLDNLTRQILGCASLYFGIDTRNQIRMLSDTDKKRDRHELLNTLSATGRPWGSSHGKV